MDGEHVAVAALEPQLLSRSLEALGIDSDSDPEGLADLIARALVPAYGYRAGGTARCGG